MMEINGPDRLRFGAYEADLHTHELWKHGTRVKLVGQPFEILALLIRRPGQLVTREELRAELWPGDTFVDFNHGLNAAVNKLRDALCDSAEAPRYIETLPRRGYRFIAAIENSINPAAATRATTSPSQAEEETSRASGAGFRDASFISTPISALAVTPDTKIVATFPSIQAAVRTDKNPRWVYLGVRVGLSILIGFFVMSLFLTGMRYYSERQEKRLREAEAPGTMTPLTALADRTSDPAFSPDGMRVAFRRESFVPGDSGIWAKQVGGEELTQLTNGASDWSPVWSPDGRSVAFSRVADQQRTIYEVPATRGDARNLLTTSLVPDHPEIDWSPDGETIVFVAKDKQGVPAIFALSHTTDTARQITSPSANDEDSGPAFSPDGSRIVFVRTNNLMLMPSGGGELKRLTPETLNIFGSPAWAADSQSILFVSRSGSGDGGLWRIPASGGMPTPLREAGSTAFNPAASKRGFRLAFESLSSARSIYQMDLYPPGQKERALVTSVSGENAGQQVSPDGRKLAFQSDRTGGLDIWVSDRNGQNPIQLTAMGTAGAPRWSPDGKEIVFDVGLGRDWREPRAIFVVNAEGGTPRPLIQDSYSNNVPSWSHDGKWIYFASNRVGGWQIWKIRKLGGPPVQVTKDGGFASMESPDGEYLYYVKDNNERPAIWRVPVAGGDETPVFPGLRPFDWGAWTLVENGILFAEPGSNGGPTISLYNFSDHGVKPIAVLDKEGPFWLTASKDGKVAIFDRPGQEESHVMLLENFR